MRINRIAPEVVELAPRVLQPGRLYISPKYRAAVHLCCCGCGEKVVTPLSPAEWRIELAQGRATLYPSIGNGSITCRSHYWIRDNRVIWAAQLPKSRVKEIFQRDQRDLDSMCRDAKVPRKPEQNAPNPSLSRHERARPNWRALLNAVWQWLTR